MSDRGGKPTYLEFEDPDDPESIKYEASEKKPSFKISVQPEICLVALIRDAKGLASDVLPAVRQLMYASYLQGKRVGQEIERRMLSKAI